MQDDKIIACVCEGNAEVAIMDILLDKERLIFKRCDLLDNEVIRCRNARKFEDRYLGKGFDKKITVYRILDSRQENFKLRKVYQSKVDVINVITAPEIEMLIIINEGKFSEYSKVKSTMKPNEYCKNTFKYSSVKSEDFVKEYFKDVEVLVFAIREYKRLSHIPQKEVCLADLLI